MYVPHLPPTCEFAKLVEESWLAYVGRWVQDRLGLHGGRAVDWLVYWMPGCLSGGIAWIWGLACQNGDLFGLPT